MSIAVLAIDLAKHVVQLHGIDESGRLSPAKVVRVRSRQAGNGTAAVYADGQERA